MNISPNGLVRTERAGRVSLVWDNPRHPCADRQFLVTGTSLAMISVMRRITTDGDGCPWASAPSPLRGAFPGFRRPPRFGARVRRDGDVHDDLDRSRSAASDHRPRLDAASGHTGTPWKIGSAPVRH